MFIRSLVAACVLASGIATLVAPASAEEVIVVDGPRAVPVYEGWQPGWDRYEYDRHHVILGTVTNFEPFRLQVARRNGNVQTIDLKNGTVIRPVGATPMPNERVAVVGYYSNGTFIANRVLIHP